MTPWRQSRLNGSPTPVLHLQFGHGSDAVETPCRYRLLLSGYFAEYAYDQGGLTPGFTYSQLAERGNFVARALAAGDAADFSARIREGVPGDDPKVTP